MKTLPKFPYIRNIVNYYHEHHGPMFTKEYRDWLSQFGFAVPIRDDFLEFPDDFSDHDLTLFVLRWT